jgi:hypothetical protein
MHPTKLVISYWADSELAFVDIARNRCLTLGIEFDIYRIAHHSSWFEPNRSIVKNALHLTYILVKVLRAGFRSNVCLFGTNVCRSVFLFSWIFRKTHFVFNELPEHKSKSPLYWLDRAIFRRARFVYVSSAPRARFVKTLYGLTRDIEVVENISFRKIPYYVEGRNNHGVVFAGSITPKRFSLRDIQKFQALRDALGTKIVVYGLVARELSPKFASLLDHRGVLPHAELMRTLPNFRYALLAYYQDEPNYDLCAPLKLYEYVAAGCRVVSINRNVGLVTLAESYPNLIFFIDDPLSTLSFRDELAFAREREAFLQDALRSNERLALAITS